MGKLTSLLKKKKSRGDNSSSLSSGMQSNLASSSSVSGTSVDAPPLSLNIRTDNHNLSAPTGAPLSLSLMDDIMDELAGTTPDTPQPKQRLSDFGLSFELSRQLDLGTADSADTPSAPSRPSSSSSNSNPNTTASLIYGQNKAVGKLGQNSAFKDNAFLRSQQQQRQQPLQQKPTTATRAKAAASTINAATTATTTSTNTTNTTTSSYQRGSILSKEAEEKAEAAAKLREASKKANAQLPSDDEGSDFSEVENSDDEELSPRKQRQLQQRLLQQQQQAALQQQLDEQQLHDLDGKGIDPMINKSRRGSATNWPPKSVEVNHEAVIDRMKDRHRAVLAGAQAAAMDDYYEEYMDDYGRMHSQQQPGALGYNMQYGLDPNMMYTMDDYRFQPQQIYYNQGVPSHNMANVMPYGHQGMNNMSGYMYNMPTTVPMGAGYPMMHGGHFPGMLGTMAHLHGGSLDQGSTASSEVSGPTLGHIDQSASPRRSSRQQSTTSSSARISENSWGAEPYYFQNTSTQKIMMSDSGYGVNGGSTSDLPFDNSQEDLQSQASESTKVNAKSDDMTKVVDVLSVGQAAGEENRAPSPPSPTMEDPESAKGGNTALLDSSTDTKDSSAPSTSSIAPSAQDENDEESSDDDDQPIILSRRGSARGQILPPKLNTFVSSNGVEYPEDAMITPVSNVSYLAHGMYQPIQGPTNIPSHMAYTPQQQQSPYGGPVPMGYQFPSPPVVSAGMGHQHSYSIERVIPVSGGPGQTAMGGNAVGGGPMMVRRAVGVPNGGYIQSAGPKQGMSGLSGNGGINNTANGAPVPSPYPIPPTTLLHPGPRRSQSMRGRPQAQKSSLPRQAHQQQQIQPQNQQSTQQQQQQPQQQQQQQQAASRNRASMDYVRLPNGGYQPAVEYTGGNFLQQQSQQNYVMQQQQMMSPPQSHAYLEKQQQSMQIQQQQQQGYYMGPSQGFGYLPNDPFPAHPHQQMYAARR